MIEATKTRYWLIASGVACLAASGLSALLATAGVPFFPARYAIDAAAGLVLVVNMVAVVIRHPIHRYAWLFVTVAGVLLMFVQLAAGTGQFWLFGDAGRSNFNTIERLLQPLADLVLVLGAFTMFYLYLSAWAHRREALARAEREVALLQNTGTLEQRVAERTAELEATNARLQAEIARGNQTAEELRGKQRVLEGLLAAHDHDRQMLAYDIHDGPVQQLTAAVMHLDTARTLYPDMPPSAREQWVLAFGLIRQALHESRGVMSSVRPPILDEQGLVAGLQYLIAEHLETEGCPVELTYHGDHRRLSPLIEGTVYRIAQEALHNIRRHSAARNGWIALTVGTELLQLTIRDDGCGFAYPIQPLPATRFGLRGIVDRATALLGTAKIETAPGAGTRLEVEVPCVDALEQAIRERSVAEQTLSERERMYRLLADHASDLIARHAADGTMLYVSPACYTLFGYQPEELVGRSPFELVHPDDRERVRAMLLAPRPEDVGVAFTFRGLAKQGTYRWIESISRPVLDPETGAATEYITDSREITDRYVAEQRLRESEERLRAIIDAAPIGIIIGEGSPGNIVYANPAARMMAEDHDGTILLGQNWHQLFRSEDLQDAMGAIQESVIHNRFHEVTIRVVTRSRAEKWIRFRAALIRLGPGNDSRRIALAEDVTQLKRTEYERDQVEDRFRELIRAIPDMVFRVRADGTLDDYVPATGLAPYVPYLQFRGRRLSEIMPPHVAELGMEAVRKALATGQTQSIEYELDEAKGLNRFEARVSPVGDDATFVFVRDVTEPWRKHLDQQAVASRDRPSDPGGAATVT